jgi:hypothetical protein
MISHSHKTVFVHIPKAAGQSVEQAFLDDLGLDWKARAPLLLRPNDDPAKGPPRLAHLAARDYVALGHLAAEDWDTFYRFAVVRDPFRRTVSLYRHLGPDMAFGEWVATWLTETLAAGPDARARWFVRSQAEFLCDARGDVMVNDVLRFESLATDFARAAQKSGLKSHVLPRRNATGHKPQPDIDGQPSPLRRLGRSLRALAVPSRFQRLEDWRAYFTGSTAARVAALYAEDFSRFGYSRDAHGL